MQVLTTAPSSPHRYAPNAVCDRGACKCSPRRHPLPTGTRPTPSAIEVVFPTQAQVGESLEGWYAGNSIPCEVQNVERLQARFAELPKMGLPRGRLCTWDGGDGAYGGASGRALAVPHIKTYCRYAADRTLPWAILASHNLSQAAWGKLEKKETQLYIKSYELGEPRIT